MIMIKCSLCMGLELRSKELVAHLTVLLLMEIYLNQNVIRFKESYKLTIILWMLLICGVLLIFHKFLVLSMDMQDNNFKRCLSSTKNILYVFSFQMVLSLISIKLLMRLFRHPLSLFQSLLSELEMLISIKWVILMEILLLYIVNI